MRDQGRREGRKARKEKEIVRDERSSDILQVIEVCFQGEKNERRVYEP